MVIYLFWIFYISNKTAIEQEANLEPDSVAIFWFICLSSFVRAKLNTDGCCVNYVAVIDIDTFQNSNRSRIEWASW